MLKLVAASQNCLLKVIFTAFLFRWVGEHTFRVNNIQPRSHFTLPVPVRGEVRGVGGGHAVVQLRGRDGRGHGGGCGGGGGRGQERLLHIILRSCSSTVLLFISLLLLLLLLLKSAGQVGGCVTAAVLQGECCVLVLALLWVILLLLLLISAGLPGLETVVVGAFRWWGWCLQRSNSVIASSRCWIGLRCYNLWTV